jgi:hypothetical protein
MLRDCLYDRTHARICSVHADQPILSSTSFNAFQNAGNLYTSYWIGMDAVGEISHTIYCSRRESSPELMQSRRVNYILVLRLCAKKLVSPRAEIPNRMGDA